MKKPHDSFTCGKNSTSSGPLHLLPVTLAAVIVIVAAATFAAAQSTSAEFPTPLTAGEISGSIRARDIGDSRTTSFYFTFDAAQGDLFVNVATKNLNGNIDLFAADGLRLLTRMVVFADVDDSETGRVVYFRKPERVVLRVEGRTPNDDPATFKIKFAGSFVASTQPAAEEPKLPEVKVDNDSGIRVNSVGTIVERRPRPTPSPVETASAKPSERPAPARRERPSKTPSSDDASTASQAGSTPTSATPKAPSRSVRGDAATKSPIRSSQPPARKQPDKGAEVSREESARKEKDVPADPLADVRLVVVFKDGRRVERPMTEVLRFTVDHGSMTIFSKDGKINRFPIADVARVTVE